MGSYKQNIPTHTLQSTHKTTQRLKVVAYLNRFLVFTFLVVYFEQSVHEIFKAILESFVAFYDIFNVSRRSGSIRIIFGFTQHTQSVSCSQLEPAFSFIWTSQIGKLWRANTLSIYKCIHSKLGKLTKYCEEQLSSLVSQHFWCNGSNLT